MKEGNVLFYDALNTFYLLLYGFTHRTIQIAREETRCSHMGYSFRLAARVLLHTSSHRQGSTYTSLCYTSRGALAGTKNCSTIKDRSDDPSHHERTLLPRTFIWGRQEEGITIIVHKSKVKWGGGGGHGANGAMAPQAPSSVVTPQ